MEAKLKGGTILGAAGLRVAKYASKKLKNGV